MTTEPPVYENWSGDTLEVLAQADDIRVTISHVGEDDRGVCVDILFADVRKVTAAMHEKAGLPDRWADLRKLVDADIDLYDEASAECGRSRNPSGATEARDKASAVRFIRVYMDDMEAGK